MHKQMVLLFASLVTLGVSGFSSTARADHWAGPISEETWKSWATCGANQGIQGAQCRGSYCDDVYLHCVNLPPDVYLDSSVKWWSDWFSDGTPNPYSCVLGPYGEVGLMTGMQCKGRYCDDMRYQCTKLGPIARLVREESAVVFSDENPGQYFGYKRYATQWLCSGRYCDTQTVYSHIPIPRDNVNPEP